MNQVLAMARIAFLDTVRRLPFWCGAAFFLTASFLGAIPFSPGIAADPGYYAEAGTSTLLLGGVFLSLMLVPLLLAAGRGPVRGEGIQALPVRRGALVAGRYAGFAAALMVFFAAGGALLTVAAGTGDGGSRAVHPLSGTAWAFLAALVAAALVLLTSRLLPYVPAVAAAVALLVLAQVSDFLPLPARLVLPALAHLDPARMAEASLGTAALAALHGGLIILLCLFLAVWASDRDVLLDGS